MKVEGPGLGACWLAGHQVGVLGTRRNELGLTVAEMAGLGKTQVGVDSMGPGLGPRREAFLWVGGSWPAMWGESGWLAERLESWHCPSAPTLQVPLFSGRFIYELEHFNGVAELLEILGR